MKQGKWAVWVLGSMVLLTGCAAVSGDENPALKLFSALGISLAAVFIVFFIIVKLREKE